MLNAKVNYLQNVKKNVSKCIIDEEAKMRRQVLFIFGFPLRFGMFYTVRYL